MQEKQKALNSEWNNAAYKVKSKIKKENFYHIKHPEQDYTILTVILTKKKDEGMKKRASHERQKKIRRNFKRESSSPYNVNGDH